MWLKLREVLDSTTIYKMIKRYRRSAQHVKGTIKCGQKSAGQYLVNTCLLMLPSLVTVTPYLSQCYFSHQEIIWDKQLLTDLRTQDCRLENISPVFYCIAITLIFRPAFR